MTLPPQEHPQYELKRRIADCRERLRRTRTGQKTAAHDAPDTHDALPNDEADEAHTPPRRPATAQRAGRH